MTSRFFTKPVVAIRYDDTGSRVVLGRAETHPHANPMPTSTTQRIIDAVEARYPQIQAYVEARPHGDMVVMSRTAERACGATPAEIEQFVLSVMDGI